MSEIEISSLGTCLQVDIFSGEWSKSDERRWLGSCAPNLTLLSENFTSILCHFKHNYAIKASTFSKLGDFSLKYQNLSKFSAPAAPKIGH